MRLGVHECVPSPLLYPRDYELTYWNILLAGWSGCYISFSQVFTYSLITGRSPVSLWKHSTKPDSILWHSPTSSHQMAVFFKSRRLTRENLSYGVSTFSYFSYITSQRFEIKLLDNVHVFIIITNRTSSNILTNLLVMFSLIFLSYYRGTLYMLSVEQDLCFFDTV